MIHLANDPNASRMPQRPTAHEGKAHGFAPQRRGAHAWPFISRHTSRPASPNGTQTRNSDSGS